MIFVVAFSRVFPKLNKLEYLSVSYTTLKSIGEGAFSELTALKTLMVTNNPHLSTIHPKALSKEGTEDPRRLEYPPLTNVSSHSVINSRRSFSYKFFKIAALFA